MRFGVLGPLAVWDEDGEPVGVTGARVRGLLARLLVAPGRAVSEEKLVDGLWGDAPPDHPRNTLQGQVSRLRSSLERAVGPGGRGLVVRDAAGYRLRVRAGDVDAEVFLGLVRQARETGDPEARGALLTEAVGLWRGPAFAGYTDEPFALAAARRLEEERLGAVEEELAVRAGLGDPAGLAGELADLTARHPLRERLRVLQLRALYAAGRQTDALMAYEEFRRRLDEELGLRPGPELVALQQAVLRHDPDLGRRTPAIPAPAARRTVAPGAVPHREEPSEPPAGVSAPAGNLPSPVAALVGRDGAVAELAELLARSRLVTLTGPGGVGKTRLALEAGHAVRERFPDGVWLVELAGVTVGDPGAVPGALTRALGVREASVAALARALRDRRLLLVLDNCEHLVEPVAAVLAELLPAVPGLSALATSQEALGVTGELPRPVAPLATDDAVSLFLARAAVPPGELAAVAELCARLDGIPLAVELAAARVRALGVRGLLARLDDRFTVLSGGGPRGLPARQRTLRAVIDWSWSLLTGPERLVLRRLAVQAEGLTPAAAEAVCAGGEVRPEDVPELLGRLAERSLVVLVDRAEGPVHRLLESVKEYAREQLAAAGEAPAVRHRHLVHHTGLALAAAPLLHGPGQARALERLDGAAAEIRLALDTALAPAGGDPGRALRTVDALAWYWVLRGRPVAAGELIDRALAYGGEARDRARAVVWRTGIALMEGDVAGGADRIRAALAPYENASVDDPEGRARALWFLGFAQLGAGDTGTGEQLLERAVDAYATLGGPRGAWGTAAALSVRARHALARGDHAAARHDAERGAALFAELGDAWGRLQTVFPLATLYEIAGAYGRAGDLHRDGLALAEHLGLPVEAAKRHTGLGRLALLTGAPARARAHHERALRIAREQNFRSGEADARLGLALGARREGDLDGAQAHLHELLTWFRETGYGPGRALVLAELGFVAEERGDAAGAYERHAEGLAVARELGDPRAVALALEGLAGAHALAGEPARAAALLGAAAAARESAGAPLPAAERRDVDRVSAAARAALGDAGYTAAYGRGPDVPEVRGRALPPGDSP
ncbi:AfsR/SARP family transcriptional regulator [Streptomyces qinzhouensis]|uniref:AfsR/SARP family transcriptional regulator n=1 Tax=Streptomyces qinzhouensis TaxID=2599401 RepID=A0A5B8J7S3_9ACTN|nr:BTAD domain-containing putative transcriptional regulator [Streptomyces qinzhouensis]QDY77286.1 AfsR/SARP family transcriptional regulator [Streptomyces qinzhouensis]